MTSPFKNKEFSEVQFVLMDIEGTTTDIDFVKNVLFPYSAKELRNFISQNKNNPEVRACVTAVNAEDDEAALLQFLKWIAEDVKHPALKTLQGLIWRRGYQTQAYQAHLYEDVLPAWQAWKTPENGGAKKIRLGIYSSGSVAAQKLLFAHTTYGDVTSHLSAYFDLEVGSKRETASYQKILQQIDGGITPDQVLFLSDIEAELQAAQSAGLSVAHIVRPGTVPSGKFKSYHSFLEI